MKNSIARSISTLALLAILAYEMTDPKSISKQVILTPEATETTTPIPARDLDLMPVFETVAGANYEGCILPCWWGFRAGVTTLNQIKQFLKETGFDRHWKLSPYSFTLEEYLRFGEPFILDFQDTYHNLGGNFVINFGFDDRDILTLVGINIVRPDKWLTSKANKVGFPQVVSQMEITPEIYISPNPTLSDYSIIVVFRQQKVQIGYTFDLTRDHLPRRTVERLCLNIERTTYITMRLNYLDSSMSGESSTPLLSIPPEKAYGISTAEFVQFFRDHPDECLDVSQYKEQQ